MKKKVMKGICIAVLTCLVGSVGVFLMTGYAAEAEHVVSASSTSDVVISSGEKYVSFDSVRSDNTALIFYGGAKVDEMAYSQLLYSLSQNGIDCYLVLSPFDLAVFNQKEAESILAEKNYDNIYLCGHSLGGVIASKEAAALGDSVNGMIYLSSYGTDDKLNPQTAILSIDAENDGVLNRERYDSYEKLMTEKGYQFSHYQIAGGNHAGYGYYGVQKGDGEAAISNDIQISETVQQMMDFMILHNQNKETVLLP